MALTINTRTYSANRVNPDSIDYAGAAQTLNVKDSFQCKRVYPKPSSNGSGVARPSVKLTRTEVINATTGETGDLIFTVSASIPNGPAVTTTMVNNRLADLAAWIDSADAQSLFNTLKISF